MKMKAISLSMGLLLAVGAATFAPDAFHGASAETAKTADVYILAGQSNAVGHSTLSQQVKNQDDKNHTYDVVISQDDARNDTGYSDVFYYGATDVMIDGTLPNPALKNVKKGQGADGTKIGPELGMAKVLSETATEDNPAVIFKFAAGGTALGAYSAQHCSEIMYTNYFGNWASPSILSRWREEERRVAKNCQGLLYERLVQLIGNGIEKLKAEGYTPVVTAYVWMQGESDADVTAIADEYARNLTDFIGDLRGAVAEKTGNASDAKKPFVIGKISSTYNNGPRGVVTVRKAEDEVAAAVPNCYTVETEDFPLLDRKTGTVVGNDICHFNAGDMYQLGQRFAETALNNIAAHNFFVTADEGGKVTDRNLHVSDGSVRIAFTAEEGLQLNEVLLDGKAIENFTVEDGALLFSLPENAPEYGEIKLTFRKISSGEFPGWAIGTIIGVSGLLLIAAGISAYFAVKKKRDASKSGQSEE